MIRRHKYRRIEISNKKNEIFIKPNRTIIHVWTYETQFNKEEILTQQKYWGLGDMIRGTIFLYQYCKKYNYKYYVDIHLHPISKYLVELTHPYQDLIHEKKDQIDILCDRYDRFDKEGFHKYIQSREDDILYFFTNAQCDEPIEENSKEFIRNLLRPKPEFLEYIYSKRDLIPYKSYNVLHIRIGDGEFVCGVENTFDEIFPSIKNIIKTNLEETDVLFSDSIYCKMELQNEYNVFTFHSQPSHIGICDNENDIRDSLVEFFLLMNCEKIKTYSTYSWISGFVYWIHVIYSIPLINLKPEEEEKKPLKEENTEYILRPILSKNYFKVHDIIVSNSKNMTEDLNSVYENTKYDDSYNKKTQITKNHFNMQNSIVTKEKKVSILKKQTPINIENFYEQREKNKKILLHNNFMKSLPQK